MRSVAALVHGIKGEAVSRVRDRVDLISDGCVVRLRRYLHPLHSRIWFHPRHRLLLCAAHVDGPRICAISHLFRRGGRAALRE